MHETGLGWFMGWEHIWYVGTGWRKRLVVMLLGGHAGLWSSALSRAATPLLGTPCRTGWTDTCVPWAARAIKAWVQSQGVRGAQGRQQCLCTVPEAAAPQHQGSGDSGLKQREVSCAARLGWHRAHPSPCTAAITPRKPLPVHPTPPCLLLSSGRNVSASLTTGLNFAWIKSLWKLKLACWWTTQKHFLSPALPSLNLALSETQSIHGGISDLVVDGSERNTILL